MAIVTTTKYGAVRVTLPYSVPSGGMPCVRVRVQSTSHAYSGYPRHRVNSRQEGHAPSDIPPKTASCATELWSKFRQIDKHINRSARNNKKAIRRQQLSVIIKISVPETQKWVKKVMRRYNTVALQSLQRGSTLDLASFTKHMETNKADISRVPERKFVVPPIFRTYIQRALGSLPN